MVVMAISGAASYLEDGDEDVPAPHNKDNPIESGSSSPENAGTSTDDSSEEEEEEEEEREEEYYDPSVKGGGDEDNEEVSEEAPHESPPGPEGQTSKGKDEMHFSFCCKKCKAVQQSVGSELVTPRRISKGRLQVQLEGDGTYQCSVTGLVFEAAESVLVRYSVLSWSRFSSCLPDSWKFAGPIFNVDTVNKDASVLKSIQFPHSVCLADPENETRFGVLHVKASRSLIEPAADHSGCHVKWTVTSLSPVGPIIQTNRSVEHHGVVLLYKQLGGGGGGGGSYSFHVYLATNSSSDIKDITKQVRAYKSRYIRIDKPPTCKLDEGTYRLISEPEGEIKPQELKFTLAVTKMKGYFEAFFEQRPPFKLSLLDACTEEAVWSATIRDGDCVDTEQSQRKKSAVRKRSSSSQSDGEVSSKRTRWPDEMDSALSQSQDITDKELLQLAKQLGNEWKQVGIHLNLEFKDLDNIQAAEKDVTMQKLQMFVTWKKRQPQGKATAFHLWQTVRDLDELPNEARQTLEDLKKNG